MILITAALERELGPFRRIAPPGVAPLVTGIGREAVERGLSAFIAEHRSQIELLISSGFAGGLAPNLRPKTLILAERLLLEDGREIRVEAGLLARAAKALEPLRAHRGSILTVAKPARDVKEKRRLGQEFGALAVEMEAFWAAEAARAYELPFLAVKVVLDPLKWVLPEFIGVLRLDRGRPWPWKATLALAMTRRPWEAWNLAQLAASAWLASRQLALALEALVKAFAIEVASGGPP